VLEKLLLFFGDFQADESASEIEKQHHDTDEVRISIKQMKKPIYGIHYGKSRTGNRKTHLLLL
jgi:hypothetical protein